MTLPTIVGATGSDRLEVDHIMIGGDPSPGKATVRGASIRRGWDIRKGYGLSGSVVVPTGDELARFSVLFEFWESAQIDQWEEFARRYFVSSARLVPGSAKPKALGIQHPLLNGPPLNITAVVVEEVSQLEQDETGGWSCEIKFLEYRQPQKAPDPPDTSIPAAQKPTPTAMDEFERAMQDKLTTLKGELAPQLFVP